MSFHIYMRPKGEEPLMRINDLPVFETPATRLTETWVTFQKGPCKDLELDYTRCAARVGVHRHKECEKFMDDLHECAYGKKAMLRYNAIQAERKKQGLPPMKNPPADSTITWHE